MKNKIDVLIAGAGVIGITVAIAIKKADPQLSVVVIEKESQVGKHASGRNSGVIHSGFYYSPNSLKAKFCKEGNLALTELCEKNRIPIRKTGKVVIARSQKELIQLEELYRRGIENGVELEIFDQKDLHKFEPLATTYERFLWSPSTAVSDPIMVLNVLSDIAKQKGVKVFSNSQLTISETNKLLVNGEEIFSKHFVNCAGAQADQIAHSFGVGLEYGMIPFMGVYRSVNEEKLPIKTLIYPVPHPINPFLGVHFTLTTDGKTKIGPTSVLVAGRETYSIRDSISLGEIKETFVNALTFASGSPVNFAKSLSSEMPKVITRMLVHDAATLVPSAKSVKGWSKRPAGIRAQLLHKPTRTLEQDFVVRSGPRSTHILNAVSPGWTSSIPFSEWVVNNYIIPAL